MKEKYYFFWNNILWQWNSLYHSLLNPLGTFLHFPRLFGSQQDVLWRMMKNLLSCALLLEPLCPVPKREQRAGQVCTQCWGIQLYQSSICQQSPLTPQFSLRPQHFYMLSWMMFLNDTASYGCWMANPYVGKERSIFQLSIVAHSYV